MPIMPEQAQKKIYFDLEGDLEPGLSHAQPKSILDNCDHEQCYKLLWCEKHEEFLDYDKFMSDHYLCARTRKY